MSGLRFAAGAGAFELLGSRLELRGNLNNDSALRQSLSFGELVMGADATWSGGSAGLAVANFQLGDHALLMKGVVQAARSSEGLQIGVQSHGELTLNGAGVSLQSLNATLAEQAGSTGRVLMSDGAQWRASGNVLVGNRGSGELRMEGGAQLHSVGAHVGRLAGEGRSTVTLSGAGTSWLNEGAALFYIGYQGHGRVALERGALLQAQRLWLAAAGGDAELELGHGTLVRSDLVFAGNDNATGSTRIKLLAGAHLEATQQLSLKGTGSLLDLSGDGASFSGATLVLGKGAAATVQAPGAQVSVDLLLVGGAAHEGLNRFQLRQGEVTVRNLTQVGDLAPARLEISGGRLNTDRLSIGEQGSVLLTGGELRLRTADSQLTALDWRGGTLATTSLSLSQGSHWGDVLVVPANGQLVVDNTLTLQASTLVLRSGASLRAKDLYLNRGQLIAPLLNLDHLSSLRGEGSVLARIQGGAGGSVQSQGVLVLGDASAADGVRFGGTVQLQAGRQLHWLDADRAELSGAIHMGAGSVMLAGNGLHLLAGARLEALEGGELRGSFHSEGQVQGATAVGKVLRFSDLVTGSGSFSGAVLFADGYDPTGSVHLEGDVKLSADSELVLDVGQDRLSGIEHLQLDGLLQLRFAPDTAAGRYSLVEFGSLAGAYRVEVFGLASERVDLSRFAIDGSIGVSAVPEPSAWALMAGGLGWLACRRRAMR
ncbi:MAG: PEP-CTERM sorting domain-containing protein [Burkholderiales bacterium]|nr:PEP-CTERM sorting domain-containing protein [Burkholderiales bacterium]